jgi:hypothetical protein
MDYHIPLSRNIIIPSITVFSTNFAAPFAVPRPKFVERLIDLKKLAKLAIRSQSQNVQDTTAKEPTRHPT